MDMEAITTVLATSLIQPAEETALIQPAEDGAMMPSVSPYRAALATARRQEIIGFLKLWKPESSV